MFGTKESKQISGAVSFPFNSSRQRGYVFYHIQLPKDQWIASNIFNYVHYHHPFQLPYEETERRILSGNFFFKDNLDQHHTIHKMKAFRDANN